MIGRQISILLILGLVLTSCKKDKPVIPEPDTADNIAPCNLTEKVHQIDSLFYGTSTEIPEAKFSVRFFDTLAIPSNSFIEFAFNKVPTTGMYQMVAEIDTNQQAVPNQITYKIYDGGMNFQASGTASPSIYVENNTAELIISYCEVPDGTYNYSATCNCYLGNGEGNVLYRKTY